MAVENEIIIGTATAYLQLQDNGFYREIERAQDYIDGVWREIEEGGQEAAKGFNLDEFATKATAFGDTMTRNVTMPIVRGAKDVIDTYRDMESAFAGVKKTIDETRFSEAFGDAVDGWEVLDQAIKEIAQSTASTYEEVAGVMEWAGQLNIPLGKGGKDIKEFTRVMVELGDSTNLSAEESAEAIAKLMNIMGTAPSDVRKLGSAIVDLGNNSATTERDIVQMAMRLAGAGAQAGLTEQEVLGIATALSSVGIRAEMGGSAFSKAIVKMQVAVETGYDSVQKLEQATGMTMRDIELMSTNNTAAFKELAQSLGMTTTEIKDVIKAGNNLNDFANIANMTTEEFVDLYKNDATGALQAFINGLGDTESHGESAIAMLDEMGFREIRLRDTLLRVSNAENLLSDSIERSNKAWDEGSALEVEANKRYETLDAQINQLNERWKDMKYDIAEILVPVLGQLMDVLDDLIGKWKELSPEQQEAIVKAVGVVAVLGPVISILGRTAGALSNIIKFGKELKALDLGSKLAGLGSKLSNIGPALSGAAQGIAGFFGQDVAGIAAAGGATAAGAFAAAVAAAIGGYALGNKVIGPALFPDDKDLYEKYSGFSGFWQLCKDTAVTAAEEIGYGWDDLKEKINIEQSWSDAKKGIQDWFISVGEWGTETGENLSGFFGELKGSLEETTLGAAQWVTDMEQKAAEAGQGFIENIQEFFNKAPEEVGHAIDSSIAEVSNFAADTGQQAKEAGENFINNTEEWFNQLPGKIDSAVNETGENINQFKENVIQDATETGQQFVENIQTTMQELPGRVDGIIQDVESGVDQFKEDVTGAAKLAGEDFVNNVWTPLKELPGDLKQEFDSAIDNAVIFVEDMAQEGLDAATEFGNNLIEAAKDIPNKMMEIGSDIVEGVWSGIKGAKDKFVSDVKGFFSSIVSGVKENLDIHSPSGVFADEVGKWIPLGILEGVEETMPLTTHEINDIIDDGLEEVNPDVELNTSFENFINTFKSGFTILLDWFTDIETRFIDSINNMADSMSEISESANSLSYSSGMSNPMGFDNESKESDMQVLKDMMTAIADQLSEAISNISVNQGGDTIIPIYIGEDLVDEQVITANQRNNFRSGGR